MRFSCRITKARLQTHTAVFNTYVFSRQKLLKSAKSPQCDDARNLSILFSQFIGVFENYEKRLLALSCLSLRPSALLEQLASHWPDFHEI